MNKHVSPDEEFGSAEPVATGRHHNGPPRPDLAVRVAHSLDDIMIMVALRGATYLAEQEWAYSEEFDGNDFSATHLIGTVDGEPAGCLRIRYFGTFARFERLAVLPRFRNSRMAFELIRYGIEFCRRKGFTRICGTATPRVTKLWCRFGFQPRTAAPSIRIGDECLIEGDLILDLADNAIRSDDDLMVVLRPEGHWDEPGIFDGVVGAPR